MKRKRRTFSAEFKARVALEAVKSQKTINEIAHAEGVLPVQGSAWKKELQQRMAEVFRSGAKEREQAEQAERRQARLERTVGQLTTRARRSVRCRQKSKCRHSFSEVSCTAQRCAELVW
jgi:transposase-like protein